MLSALNHGSAIRQTDATAINAKSSRSHAVFSLNLIQRKSQITVNEKRQSISTEAITNSESSVTVDSKLHFVDLAGSERLKNTGAIGERAKEGISINAGLASLGKVISQLSSRQAGSHVSYRDSKLTRLLQDSLGGNAITYMIACVTPAEFHLSETLNTVQYAQRARAIQIKPRIQQINDESDKQAIIDRLRAEVAFLRQQIHNTEGPERRNGSLQERMDRPNEREVELQNQLLDVQESYTALSQRHAKVISELTKSGESAEDPIMNPTSAESSVNRLKRSQANQEQIEHMVLEYEKTIQILESNLSNTRASLASTESNLLEKETKCAYTETINHQIHSRLQKLIDRESNTEMYLRELEARLDGQSSGEEKNGATIIDLHKQIARIRESESNAEDYISTLEERLAEADQDMDILQREVERLEHVVDRQRSLGKIDTLLYELDHIQQSGHKSGEFNRFPNVGTSAFHGYDHDEKPLFDALKEAEETPLPEGPDEDLLITTEPEADANDLIEDDDLETLARATSLLRSVEQPSPAQARHMADKIENVTSELFDLRVEHENTLNEYDLLSAKYKEALRTLAQMQEMVADEAHHAPSPSVVSPQLTSRPTSVAGEIDHIEQEARKPLSSSRSLSSEPSLAEDNSSVDAADTTQSSRDFPSRDVAGTDVDKLQRMLAEHEHGMGLVTQQYAQLQAEHQKTLETVQELKAEIQKTKVQGSTPPGPMSPVIRRGTSQNVVVTDRANRSLASLRTLMAEEFEGRPNKMETAELHLHTASHELHSRLERIQCLEAEMKSVKKEMDAKMTIISGLTRERNSLKGSSPVELSMVSQMRDQFESEIRSLHESRAFREEELLAEIKSLKESNARRIKISPSSDGSDEDNEKKVYALQTELSDWQSKHKAAVDAAQASQKQLLTTTAELEASMASLEAIRVQQGGDSQGAFERAAAAKAMQVERGKHTDLIESLKRDIEEHKSLATRLEQRNESMRHLIAQHERELTQKDEQLGSLRERLTMVEKEAAEHKASIENHKHGLRSLHETHAIKMEEMKLSHAGQLAEMDDERAELTRSHEQAIRSLNTQLEKSRSDLQSLLSRVGSVLGHATSVDMLHEHIQDLLDEKALATDLHTKLAEAHTELESQLEAHRGNISQLHESSDTIADYEARIRSLTKEIADCEDKLREKDESIRRRDVLIDSITVEKKNNARIIEELEQQIEASFDHHQNRLSVMQQQGNQALVEAQARIIGLEKDLGLLRGGSDLDSTSRTDTMKSAQRPQSPQADGQSRSSPTSSNLRKSASVASLPSPPPAIPLPPLPALPTLPSIAAMNGFTVATASTSPPSSRHGSKEIPASPNHQTQLIEDQRNRIDTIEKLLNAEKQLTATLEEALIDLETRLNKLRVEMEGWKKKACSAEEEVQSLRREKKNARESIQAVEIERDKRREAEVARAQLEERMNQLSRKKKKNALNCF